ncbi:MAG: hypothetical protein ABS53_01660 [Hydrogenophaga sp. SCN 70-13]|uniref:BPSS1780 family membrane protein n=1 Tax=unclassified Hydrogenophaga TaxID=2610897 RepID=UPI000869EC4E|nr:MULTISPECIES: BPSS1780 family membrane protein [unclassified Hydrogenophaga]MBN9370339.1 hypothetical protein [Hydrogenophaga sp.]ODT34302.1 MAG: hypothetical protein ABS53_01660 [Hydrogenophaga sp. SCN 70-13]OJV62682.1 MAG: hypothetical protein BGO22_05780 [Hydrogenophaga sp. 70-12]
MKLQVNKASLGWLWVKLGMRTFLRQPLAMSGLFFMFMALVSVLSIVPILGTAVAAALVPAATLGLMAATREAEQGRFPMPSLLLTAFRGGTERRRGMLLLGAMYAVALFLVMGVGALFTDGAPTPLPEGTAEVTPEMVGAAVGRPGLWAALLAYLPVLMAFWHAPALVFWHGVPPAKSLFFSLVACWSNRGAMLLFVAGWTVVFMLTGLLLGMLGSIVGGPEVMQVVVYPIVLFMASMFHTSLWFTVRDSFAFDAPEPDASRSA